MHKNKFIWHRFLWFRLDSMKMLNVGIGPETGNNRELNSDDKPIDLHGLVRVFLIYTWDSTYKDKLIVHW